MVAKKRGARVIVNFIERNQKKMITVYQIHLQCAVSSIAMLQFSIVYLWLISAVFAIFATLTRKCILVLQCKILSNILLLAAHSAKKNSGGANWS